MVFGNMGETSGTGVGFTRNPATGKKEFYGEFLMNAQGEDVVSGVRTPVHISELEKIMPEVYNQLRDITSRMEKHYRDMQDFEFTIQDGKLYMLQTRNGKRTGLAAVRVAIDMVEEGLISKEEAIFRVEPNQLYDFLVPRLDEKGAKVEVLATGLPASPGAAVGQIVFTANDAVSFKQKGKMKSVILVRGETTPEDIHGMEVAYGILTSRGGMTSHAAVVTRGMGKCCVAGAGDIAVDEKKTRDAREGPDLQGRRLALAGRHDRPRDQGQAEHDRDAEPDDPDLVKFMSWADPYRKLGVRANADIPRDAKQAAAVRRRRHRPVPHRAHVLRRGPSSAHAHHDSGRQREGPPHGAQEAAAHAARRLRRAVQGDGRPAGYIRTLDPPLHEFLPKREDLMVEIARLEITKPKSPKLKELRTLLARVEELHEINPMLGHRGCRLGITYPEITEMQARAILEAAVDVQEEGHQGTPGDHDPAHQRHQGDEEPG